MDDKSRKSIECGSGLVGDAIIVCDNGSLSVESDTCRENIDCPSGTIKAPGAEYINIDYSVKRDREIFVLPCPEYYEGNIEYVCKGGEIERIDVHEKCLKGREDRYCYDDFIEAPF
eukprot:UN34359